jgi:hypothetical protein
MLNAQPDNQKDVRTRVTCEALVVHLIFVSPLPQGDARLGVEELLAHLVELSLTELAAEVVHLAVRRRASAQVVAVPLVPLLAHRGFHILFQFRLSVNAQEAMIGKHIARNNHTKVSAYFDLPQDRVVVELLAVVQRKEVASAGHLPA